LRCGGSVQSRINPILTQGLRSRWPAAAVEPDAAKALQEGWTRHRAGHLQMARALVATGAVRPGLTLDDVDAALALTTWSGQQLQARNGLGWSGPTWERWCVKFLTDALLGGGEPVVLP
jgi:hypothetical protein